MHELPLSPRARRSGAACVGLLTLLTAVAAAAPARSPLTPDRLPCPLVSEAPGEVRVLANRPFALTDTVVLTAR